MSHLAYRTTLATVLLSMVVLTGCSLSGSKTDVVPGVIPPAERIEALEGIEKRIGSASGVEQQTTSTRLANEFRSEEDPLIRVAIVGVLGQCATPTAAETLGLATTDSSREVRIASCKAWVARGGVESVTRLSEVLGSDLDVDVRLAAAKGLGVLGDPAAVPALGLALESNDPAMRYRATQSLRSCADVDFGADVQQWQQYVRGGPSAVREPASVASRLRLPF